jgi:hypothetical protein
MSRPLACSQKSLRDGGKGERGREKGEGRKGKGNLSGLFPISYSLSHASQKLLRSLIFTLRAFAKGLVHRKILKIH